jgi:hypothetical protein
MSPQDRVTTTAAPRTAAFTGWATTGALIAAAPAVLRALAVPGDPVCARRALTHVNCPTCGLTRALALLTRGDLAASLALHPWAPVLAAQAIAGWFLWGAWLAGRVRQRPDRWMPHALAVNGLALGAIWLVRLATGTLPAGQ